MKKINCFVVLLGFNFAFMSISGHASLRDDLKSQIQGGSLMEKAEKAVSADKLASGRSMNLIKKAHLLNKIKSGIQRAREFTGR